MSSSTNRQPKKPNGFTVNATDFPESDHSGQFFVARIKSDDHSENLFFDNATEALAFAERFIVAVKAARTAPADPIQPADIALSIESAPPPTAHEQIAI